MIVGASYPVHGADATFAMVSGAAHADYPVTNLSDAGEILRPLQASAAGAIAFSCVLAADQEIELLTLAHHNAEDGETYRFRSYSDAGMTALVDDSTALAFDVDATADFPQVTPYRLPSAMTVRAIRVDLSAQTAAWQIGAFIPSGFWDLSEHDARALGLMPKDGRLDVGDGVTHGTRQFSPRMITLGNSLIDWTTEGRTFHDFQRDVKCAEPFVFVRDYGDATTWPRECVLVRNRTLPALSKGAWIFGGMALDMVEHLG
jgi:hypothetical protein